MLESILHKREPNTSGPAQSCCRPQNPEQAQIQMDFPEESQWPAPAQHMCGRYRSVNGRLCQAICRGQSATPKQYRALKEGGGGGKRKVAKTHARQRTQATAEPITFTPSSPAYFPPAHVTQHVHCKIDNVACNGCMRCPALAPLSDRQGKPVNLALRGGSRTSHVPTVHVDSRTAAVCGAQLEHDRKHHTPAIPRPSKIHCASAGSAEENRSDCILAIQDASCFRPRHEDTSHAAFGMAFRSGGCGVAPPERQVKRKGMITPQEQEAEDGRPKTHDDCREHNC